jgi:hypothetical protein
MVVFNATGIWGSGSGTDGPPARAIYCRSASGSPSLRVPGIHSTAYIVLSAAGREITIGSSDGRWIGQLIAKGVSKLQWAVIAE